MFGKFVEGARDCLKIARQFSYDDGKSSIDTYSILYGLVKENMGIAAAVLRSNGITDKKISDFESAKKTSPVLKKEYLPFSDGAKQVLENTVSVARKIGVSYVGTEHLLLGLLATSCAAKDFLEVNSDVERVKQDVYEIIGQRRIKTILDKKQKNPNKKGSKTNTLKEFSTDLTALAREGALDPVIGRDSEIERVLMILSRRIKNNPILIGEPGVGKTAIAEGVAQLLVSGDVPADLADYKLISLDLAGLVAGAKYRGQFEERLKAIMDEIIGQKVILFIDEFHTIIGAGGVEGGMDAANVLKPALSRGQIRCIGATTYKEYREYVEKDAALTRRFNRVTVKPPSKDTTLKILKGVTPLYEKHYGMPFEKEAIKVAVDLADRYIPDRFMPDKALDLLDEAGARVLLKMQQPDVVAELTEKINKYKNSLEVAVENQDYTLAAKLKTKIDSTQAQLEEHEVDFENKSFSVTAADVRSAISKITKIPLDAVKETSLERLKLLQKNLEENIIGQDSAKQSLLKCLRRSRAGLSDPNRPMGSFLFTGPTGVGKTLIVKELANSFFGSDSLVSLDMSEFMEKHSASKLIGAPPGYVGYDRGGQLTEAVRRKPYSVILFDEIEKAHPDVSNLLLQILEEGTLTDSNGIKVNFKNTIIVMTSNLGSRAVVNRTGFGFKPATGTELVESQVSEEITKFFRPELINRLDAIIPFHKLTRENLEKIIDLEVSKVCARLESLDRELEVSSSTIDFLLEKGYNEDYGARPLRKAVERYLEDLLSEQILSNKFPPNTTAQVSAEDNSLKITVI